MDCPVSCGSCCSLWHNVVSIRAAYLDRPTSDPCPHLGEDGCSLQTRDRPDECTFYLCTQGALSRLLQAQKQQGGSDKVVLRDALAEMQHRKWQQWAKYMLENTSYDNMISWKRWIATDFWNLRDDEKTSDYAWADKIISLIKPFLENQNGNI